MYDTWCRLLEDLIQLEQRHCAYGDCHLRSWIAIMPPEGMQRLTPTSVTGGPGPTA